MSTETLLKVGGMTCDGCSNRVKGAIEEIEGVFSALVTHQDGSALVTHSGVSENQISSAIISIGYSVGTDSAGFDWSDRGVWKQSAHNTKWCLIGCSIGEFGTLAY